jgi:hypothetical protein
MKKKKKKIIKIIKKKKKKKILIMNINILTQKKVIFSKRIKIEIN